MTNLFENLKDFTRKLPKPTDYFSGLGAETPFLKPENLLLFSRTNAAELGQMEGMPMKIRQHSRWVLMMCLTGKARVYVDEHSYSIDPGEIILIRPFEVHTISELSASDTHWVFLTFDLPVEMLLHLNSQRYYQKATDWFWQLCQACVDAYMANDDLTRHSTSNLASLLLIEMINTEQEKQSRTITKNPLPETYKLIRSFMKSTPIPDWDVPNAAAYCHLSPSRLRARFKENMQMSLGSYLQHCRLMNAAKELKTSSKSLTEISELSGYDSAYSFSRAFKAMFGTPPGTYRKSAV